MRSVSAFAISAKKRRIIGRAGQPIGGLIDAGPVFQRQYDDRPPLGAGDNDRPEGITWAIIAERLARRLVEERAFIRIMARNWGTGSQREGNGVKKIDFEGCHYIRKALKKNVSCLRSQVAS